MKRQFNCSLAANFAKVERVNVHWLVPESNQIMFRGWVDGAHLHVIDDLLEETAEAAIATDLFDADIHDRFSLESTYFTISLFSDGVLCLTHTHTLHSDYWIDKFFIRCDGKIVKTSSVSPKQTTNTSLQSNIFLHTSLHADLSLAWADENQ
jgi:hypothetical protein